MFGFVPDMMMVCGCVGVVVVNVWCGSSGGSRMAATTAVAERYTRQINDQESTEVEAAWGQRWKGRDGSDSNRNSENWARRRRWRQEGGNGGGTVVMILAAL